jgi:hypothetical protein
MKGRDPVDYACAPVSLTANARLWCTQIQRKVYSVVTMRGTNWRGQAGVGGAMSGESALRETPLSRRAGEPMRGVYAHWPGAPQLCSAV